MVGWWITHWRGALSKVATIEAAKKEESDLEVVANNLDIHPKVFSLCTSGDFVEQVPEKK